MDENTLAKLQEIRKKLEVKANENKDSLHFPKGHCGRASIEVRKELNFPIVAGEFLVGMIFTLIAGIKGLMARLLI